MTGEKIKYHDIGVDIIKIIAFLCVIGIHFFTFGGYRESKIDCNTMYFLTFFRSLFSVCVPSFLLVTGYLQGNKEIEIEKAALKKFYFKISRVLLTYLFASIFIIVFIIEYLNEVMGKRKIIANILGFEQYGWYVDMYIGLYLLIPFLNILWREIKKKEGHVILILILCCFTFLPSLFNVVDIITPGAIIRPWLADGKTQLFPKRWDIIFPITYYYIGAYIKKYINVKKLNSLKMFVLFLMSGVVVTAYNIWKSYSSIFFEYGWGDWQKFLVTVTLFLFVNSIDFSRINSKVSYILSKISELTFGAYLLSWIPDKILHKEFIEYSDVMFERYSQMPKYYIKSVVVALVLAFFVDCIVKVLFKVKYVLVNRYNTVKEKKKIEM